MDVVQRRAFGTVEVVSPPVCRAVLVLSENWTLTPATNLRAIVEIARIAEACGVDTVMLSEHVVLGNDSCSSGPIKNPRDYAAPGNQEPHTPWPDSVVLASAIAASTPRFGLHLPPSLRRSGTR
jgi:alkanesulfonate monooxygenase SsuD/methylene tetrahydromethanopterin reductase-like flavin-dependent oxidoreductase (luciferase family)